MYDYKFDDNQEAEAFILILTEADVYFLIERDEQGRPIVMTEIPIDPAEMGW